MASSSDLHPALEVALAWQPRASRPALRTLFALDQRLAAALARASEPLLAQVRLAWWRERLGEPTGNYPKGEPLLELVARHWGEQGGELAGLVDGWEHLIDSPPHDPQAVRGFADGRARALAAFARLVGAEGEIAGAAAAGEAWALAELSRAEPPGQMPALPRIKTRKLRGVAVLAGLSRRALGGGEPLMQGRAAALLAIRLGMFGG